MGFAWLEYNKTHTKKRHTGQKIHISFIFLSMYFKIGLTRQRGGCVRLEK